VTSAVRVVTVARWVARVWRSWTPVAVTVRLLYIRLDQVCARAGTDASAGAATAIDPVAARATAIIAVVTDRRARVGL
jgi:hypothetical protein